MSAKVQHLFPATRRPPLSIPDARALFAVRAPTLLERLRVWLRNRRQRAMALRPAVPNALPRGAQRTASGAIVYCDRELRRR